MKPAYIFIVFLVLQGCRSGINPNQIPPVAECLPAPSVSIECKWTTQVGNETDWVRYGSRTVAEVVLNDGRRFNIIEGCANPETKITPQVGAGATARRCKTLDAVNSGAYCAFGRLWNETTERDAICRPVD